MKLTLSLISLALVGVLLLQWRDWPPDAPEPLPTAADADQSPAAETPSADNQLAPLPPKEDYASVIERPLFLPDRRPPPDEPEEEPLPEEVTDLTGTDLNAVLITPALVSAWVRTPSSPELVRLRLGDDFEGWTVSTIEPDRLVLERQGETNELILRDYAAPASPRPAARRPAAPPSRQNGARRLPRPPSTPPVSRLPPRPD